MKRKICGAIIGISLLLIFGIVGGIENGESLANALWCFPLIGAICASICVGGFYYDGE